MDADRGDQDDVEAAAILRAVGVVVGHDAGLTEALPRQASRTALGLGTMRS